MTPYRKRKTEATGPMAHDMQVRGFAEGTIDSYTYHVDRFCKHFGKRPEDRRSNKSQAARRRLRKNATKGHPGQGGQAALRAALAETLTRAESLLEGHSSFLTPMVYLHCRQEHLGSAPSPADWLPVRQCPRWTVPDPTDDQ